jgi:hypothetical protein
MCNNRLGKNWDDTPFNPDPVEINVHSLSLHSPDC